MIDRAALLAAVPQLAGCHILVIGDLFLDEYLIGRAARLSREAPVPVLEFEESRQLPGGGANPSANIVALGGRVTQIGVVGDDRAGRVLVSLLETTGIDGIGVVVDPDRPTTTKRRVVSRGSLRFPQQIARIDHIDRRPLSSDIETQVIARIEQLAPAADAILVSDYRSGLVTTAVVAAVQRTREDKRLVCVDSQGRLDHFVGFDLMKCNHHEAEDFFARATGQESVLKTERSFEEATSLLRDRLQVGIMLVTRGSDGLSMRSDSGYAHLPAANRSEVFDVTGAGDTVVAVASLALASGQDALTSALLANFAAGLVVRRLGVAAPSPDELAWAVTNWSS